MRKYYSPVDIESVRAAITRGQFFGKIGVFLDDGIHAQCHVCGEWFVSVASHAMLTHGLLADEYRELFGLRFGQGLISEADRQRRRQRGIEEYPKTKQYLRPGTNDAVKRSMLKQRGRPQRLQAVMSNRDSHPAGYVDQVCRVCHKHFLTSLTDRRVTCSDKCRLAARQEDTSLRGSQMASNFWQHTFPLWPKERQEAYLESRVANRRDQIIEVPCAICGKAVSRPLHRFLSRRRRPTCSLECLRQLKHDQQLGRHHTEESREKMRQVAIERHQKEGGLFGR